MARDLGTLQYIVDIDTSGVLAGAAEVEATLKAIPDETVNLKIDTDVESLRVGRAELVKYQKLLRAAKVTEDGSTDARRKAYKALPQQLQAFIRANKGVENSLKTLDAGLNNNAAAMKQHNDITKRSAEIADRNSLALAKLTEKHAKLNAEIDKRQRNPFAQDTERERAAFNRLNVELESTRRQYAALGGDVNKLSTEHDREIERVSRLVRGFANLRLRFGFFSASVQQVAIGLAVLGPAISAALGGVVALAGSLGQGLVGAFGIATAAAGGFGLSLLGIGLAVKPLVSELSTAAKAAIDYQKQVLKTGKGSEEAQGKLEDYRQTVKNLPKDTQALIQKTGVLVTEWQKVTDAVRPQFFQTAGIGIQSLSKLMPMFAQQTKSAFSVVATEVQALARGLGGAESRDILSTMMTNSTKALPGFIRGMGSITAAVGRFGAASSSYLPSIADGFAKFGESLSNMTQAKGFQGTVDSLIGQLKSIGALAVAATKYFLTLANAGAASGKQIIDALTAGFNRWNQWMKSTEGRNSLADFFKQSVTELKLLYSAFSPLIKTLARWAQATRPISQAILRIVSVFSSLVEVVSRAGFVMKAFAAFFAARLLKNGVIILLGLRQAWKVIRGAILASTFATAANTEATAANVVATEADTVATEKNTVAKTENAAANRMSGLSMLGFGGTATRTAGTVGRLGMTLGTVGRFLGGPWGMAITTAVLGLIMYKDQILGLFGHTETFNEQLKSIAENQDKANTAIEQATGNIQSAKDAYKNLEQSVKDYNKAVEEGRRPDKSLGDIKKQGQEVSQQQKEAAKNLRDYVGGIRSARGEARNLVSTSLSSLLQPDKAGKGGGGTTFGAAADEVQALRHMLDSGAVPSIKKVNNLLKGVKLPPELKKAIDTWLVTGFDRLGASVNVARAKLGKLALPPQVTRNVGQLFSELPKKSVASLTDAFAQMEPQAVRKTTALLQRVTSAGKTGEAIKLAAKVDPKNVDSSLRAIRNRVKALDLPETKVKIKPVDGGFNALLKKLTKPDNKNVKVSVPNLKTVQSDLQKWIDDAPTKRVRISPYADPSTVNVEVKATGGVRRATGGPVAPTEKAAPGRRVDRPTFMVGEENRTEFVIATNPTYRNNNLKYWMQAGAALGVPGFKGGGANGPHDLKPTPPGIKHPYKAGYDQLKNLLIPWSEAETTASSNKADRDLNILGLPKDYPALIGDVDRTIWYYNALQKKTTARLTRAKKQAKNKKLKKDKRKEARSKAKELAVERFVTIPQALSDLQKTKQDLKDESEGGGQSSASGNYGLSAARYNLYKDFGSNTISAGGIGGMSFGSAGNISFAGATAPMAGSTSLTSDSNTTRSGSGRAAQTVNVTNNYQEPPTDPHTWSKNLQWELGAI